MSDKQIKAIHKALLEQRKLVSSSKEAATALLTELGLLKAPKSKAKPRRRKTA